ncbi:MAG: putative manganese-dependent inorganic diphosphatase [Bacilli bacterium]|jgi:manganese-dependent inorganic pyrophosphatase
MSENITHVFGHQNPDTDSICSALAYAALKHAEGHKEVVAARLGPISKETQYALDFFGVKPPEILTTVEPQISDLSLQEIPQVHEDDPVLSTLKTIADTPGRSTPVVDSQNKLIGVVSIPDLIGAFTNPYVESMLKDTRTPYKNILDILNGSVIKGDLPERVRGNIYSNSQLVTGQKLEPVDIVITSHTDADMPNAFNTGAGVIIISNLKPQENPKISKDYTGAVITTEYSPFEAVRLMTQVIPIRDMVKKNKVEYFVDYETLDDVKQNMLTSGHNRFPVVNEAGEVLGSISKSSLVDFNRKKVILVDHNERSQSIQGIEEAEITEVIDHHRINDITSSAPLYLRLEPVGCTSTIITEMFREKGLAIPEKMAGLMLSAILSDTLVFNSPTCTQRDREAAARLAEIAGVDPKAYGRELLIAGSNIGDLSPKEILGMDRKRFTMGEYKVTISQINTGDYRGMYKQLTKLLAEMEDYCGEYDQDLYVLMITDIVLGGSELVIAGKSKELAKAAFDIDESDFSAYFPGYFSRKKQVVPKLMNAASQYAKS